MIQPHHHDDPFHPSVFMVHFLSERHSLHSVITIIITCWLTYETESALKAVVKACLITLKYIQSTY